MISTLHTRCAVKKVPVSPWRWAALIALVATFLHDRFHIRIANDATSALVPPASALTIWTVIQLVVIWYGLAQLTELGRRVATYDRVSRLLVLIAGLSSLRLMQGELWLVAAVSVSIAGASAVAYLRMHREIAARRASQWLGLPFSLLLGWSTMIAIAALDATISGPSVMLVAAASVGAIYLGLSWRDYVLPGLVAWMVMVVCATNRLSPMVKTGALLAGTLCAIAAIVIAATQFSRTRPVASPSPSRLSRRA